MNAKSVRLLAESLGVAMPISAAVYELLYGGLTPQEALELLLDRDLKREI